MNNTTVLKGTICYAKSLQEFITIEDGYLVIEEGRSKGVFSDLPKEYQHIPVTDYSGKLLIPGLVDLHMHAPQYSFAGTGMDMELLDWLNTYTFPEEAKYESVEYARLAYTRFVKELKNSPTTRAVVFGTLHVKSTLLLMELLEQSGMKTYVGKVNMDRNSPAYLCHETGQEEEETREWIQEAILRFHNTKPILTPRFIPSCSDALLEKLSKIQKDYHLPVQSHLSENPSEIDWVKELCPESSCYANAYERQEMLPERTIMAHCIYSDEEEQKILKDRGVYVAHCPESNINLASGIAPIRKYLSQGIKVGIGTDVAAGTSLNMFQAVVAAIQASKLYWRMADKKEHPLTFEEAFYLATKGGGAFFGRCGSLEEGYEADVIVADPAPFLQVRSFTPREQLERLFYLGGEDNIIAKYVAGEEILHKQDQPVLVTE